MMTLWLRAAGSVTNQPMWHFMTQEEGASKEQPGSEETTAIPSENVEPVPTEESKTPQDAVFVKFLQEVEALGDAESRLKRVVSFMEEALSQAGNPQFRHFWEARKLCLPLFKENINPLVRSELWSKYSDLSKEARRLKEIFDEQSAFNVEQLEIAITALEKDLEGLSDLLAKAQDIQLPEGCQTLQEHHSHYSDIQKELDLLNTFAVRVTQLRKELLKTEMRIRHKNKFFQRLSAAGDKIFPRRKELIKDVSETFAKDVDAFLLQAQNVGERRDLLFALREDIKAMQGFAKVLTLNTKTFAATRAKLSGCWDKVKDQEKELKKEQAERREASRGNVEGIQKLIQEFSDAYAAGGVSIDAAFKQLDDISQKMRKTDLSRQDVRELREALGKARDMVEEKVKAQEAARHEQEHAKEAHRQEELSSIRERLQALIQTPENYDVATLNAEKDTLSGRVESLIHGRGEKNEFDRLFKKLRDVVHDKQEQALMTISDDERQNLQQLRQVLKQRKARRQEVKDHLDALRKATGSVSGLDFDQAMAHSQLINEEKDRLEKADVAIQDIQRKIQELETAARAKTS